MLTSEDVKARAHVCLAWAKALHLGTENSVPPQNTLEDVHDLRELIGSLRQLLNSNDVARYILALADAFLADA